MSIFPKRQFMSLAFAAAACATAFSGASQAESGAARALARAQQQRLNALLNRCPENAPVPRDACFRQAVESEIKSAPDIEPLLPQQVKLCRQYGMIELTAAFYLNLAGTDGSVPAIVDRTRTATGDVADLLRKCAGNDAAGLAKLPTREDALAAFDRRLGPNP